MKLIKQKSIATELFKVRWWIKHNEIINKEFEQKKIHKTSQKNEWMKTKKSIFVNIYVDK